MLRNQSVATIDAPEFINVTPCNDMISECQIKVFYLGQNRNGSFITREVAIEMANSLPGVPIVAAYNKDKEDFGDHGQVITVEDGEVKFSCKTVPYGFVAPNAEVWFQKYVDTDPFGNSVEREYLVTTGYLWTGQYPEIQKAIDEGLPQSMELDGDSMDGRWATDNESGVDFFIINDAKITKLCALGSDVEPCFEGASITSLDQYSTTPNFVFTLLEMRKELNTLYSEKGGFAMAKKTPAAEQAVEENFVKAPQSEKAPQNSEGKKDEEEQDESEKDDEEEKPSTDHVAPAEEDEKDSEKDDEKDSEEEEKDDEEEKPSTKSSLESKKYAELESKYAATLKELDELQTKYAAAQQELESLVTFKNQIEEQQKDAEIAKFSMLSEDEKAEVIAHKSEYSVEEIKSKLAIVYFEKNMSLHSLETSEEEKVEEAPVTTFSLDEAVDTAFVSPLVQALRDAKQN